MKSIIIYIFLITFGFSAFSQSQKIVYRQQLFNGLVKIDRSYFFYKNITQNDKKTETIHFKNTGKDTIEIVFKTIPSYINLETQPRFLAPKEEGIITASYDATKNINKKTGKTNWGKDYKRIPVYIKGKDKLRNARTDFITFRAFINEDFSYLSKRELKNAPVIKFDTIVFNYGKVEQGAKIIHDFIFKNLGKRDLEIRYAKGC